MGARGYVYGEDTASGVAQNDADMVVGSGAIQPPTAEMIEARLKADAQDREWHNRRLADERAAVERQLRAAALEGAIRTASDQGCDEVLRVAGAYLAFIKGDA